MQPITNRPGRRKTRINVPLQGSPSVASTARTNQRKASDPDLRVRANPQMDGSDHLELVRFTADFGAKVRQEWVVPASQLEKTLNVIQSAAIRQIVLEQLRFGMRTELPGTYTVAQLPALGLRKLQ
jgi:hypothetical protein